MTGARYAKGADAERRLAKWLLDPACTIPSRGGTTGAVHHGYPIQGPLLIQVKAGRRPGPQERIVAIDALRRAVNTLTVHRVAGSHGAADLIVTPPGSRYALVWAKNDGTFEVLT